MRGGLRAQRAHRPQACLSCDECVAACVRSVRIARRLGELKAIFA
jgi:ferredoxin